MEKIFDVLINSFIKDEVGIADNFLSVSLASHLKENLINLFNDKIHQNNSLQYITPENGKSVFFKSNKLEHEVLITNTQRMSIIGWLKIS
ncbi:2OG-Fe(II) oxygenase family protein [Pedobacter paludis]|uniref:Uncharacterized protein n=1 Tax=Pedobacter paludis TaxID=2203212 RepID=A0A317ETR4_9SPHI|nr:2OG-Fe(II) oxygenase family protein [Pedobacter paludis]PWS30341.1 hypothetical protein DF947_18100 [Pedobacter paludis]